jgi:hypothetical protein
MRIPGGPLSAPLRATSAQGEDLSLSSSILCSLLEQSFLVRRFTQAGRQQSGVAIARSDVRPRRDGGRLIPSSCDENERARRWRNEAAGMRGAAVTPESAFFRRFPAPDGIGAKSKFDLIYKHATGGRAFRCMSSFDRCRGNTLYSKRIILKG